MTFSLEAQIAEVEREIVLRKDVYARQCNAGKMRRSVADYRIQCMEAVLETLRAEKTTQDAVREVRRREQSR